MKFRKADTALCGWTLCNPISIKCPAPPEQYVAAIRRPVRLAVAVCLLSACWPAFSATFIVQNTNDLGAGSLREAIVSANLNPGLDTITFNIGTPPPRSIHLLRALPPVTDPVIIDGTTQPGFAGLPILELKSRYRPPGPCLLIQAGGSTVRGLVLNQFGAGGIVMVGNGGNVVEGNFIGTDLSGTIRMAGSDSAGDIVISNSSFNVIGGASQASRNLISGNSFAGVSIMGDGSAFNEVVGNLIGTDISAANPLGNGRGIIIRNFARNSTIGGGTAGAGNVIAFNGVGVVLQSSADGGHAILGNSISMNDSLGIDLNNDGVTANDSEDSDSGPNNLQNFPVLTLATNTGGATVVTGSLQSQPNFAYRLEFFSSPQCDPSGAGEGKNFLSALTVTTDEIGNAPFNFSLPTEVPVGSVITATATDDGSNTSEFSPCAVVQPALPPFITQQPESQIVAPGTDVILRVTASPSPLRFQWRRNGADLPDETNDTLQLPDFQPQDGGSYTVAVENDLGAVQSLPAIVRTTEPLLDYGDDFTQAGRLPSVSGLGHGNNFGATRQSGEPRHAGKAGGKSVWVEWFASANGIVTFSTAGSTFDTLLAAYTVTPQGSLTDVGGDDDSGKFFNSTMSFNAVAGRVYYIAIDGFAMQEGFFVLNWKLRLSILRLPEILTHPLSQTVGMGQPAELTVTALPQPGVTFRYQWFFNGQPITGANAAALMIPSVDLETVGSYVVRVANADGSFAVDSREALLQVNETDLGLQQVLAVNKFRDAVDAARSGSLSLAGSASSKSKSSRAKLAARGFSGTQLFSSVGSTTEGGEPIHCSVLGGASYWFTYQAPTNGMATISTEGSGYNTVLAVYRGPGDDFATLVPVACDNNSGADRLDSKTTFAATGGTIYWIAIDGVRNAFGKAATGSVKLTWNLVATPLPTSLLPLELRWVRSIPSGVRFTVAGSANVNFTIQASTNLVSWESLLTTSSSTGLYEFTNTNSLIHPRRFYRARYDLP